MPPNVRVALSFVLRLALRPDVVVIILNFSLMLLFSRSLAPSRSLSLTLRTVKTMTVALFLAISRRFVAIFVLFRLDLYAIFYDLRE